MKARLSQGLTFQSKYDEAASFPEKQEIRNQDKIAGADTKIAVSTPLCPESINVQASCRIDNGNADCAGNFKAARLHLQRRFAGIDFDRER